MTSMARPDKKPWTAYFDGCCEPVNPGGTASFGAVVFDPEGVRVWECSRLFIPIRGRERETSNNVAEYGGFISILEWFLENGLQKEKIVVYGDSNLVIQQQFGDWRIKKGHYVPHALRAKEMVKQFKKLDGQWIPREENDIADELSKAELLKAGVVFRIQPEESQAHLR
jgi:ribonuclease HI